MHWLEEWRMNYRRKNGSTGISREELAAMVRRRGVGCSETLIAILEKHEKGVTHPGIADKIIDVVGGTQEQFDSIVAEIHRGKRPGKRRRRQKDNPFNGTLTRKPVVRLDASGNVMDRYVSAAEAARDMECTPAPIQKRCARTLGGSANEFLPYGCTYRYAEEWDRMTEAQRAEDMRRAGHIE